MVNPGAIAATSLVPGATPRRSGASSRRGSRASPAASSRSTTRSTARRRATNQRNHSSPGCSQATTASTAIRPRRSTSTRGSARSASPRGTWPSMGATLADGGVEPATRERVVGAESCRYTLAVMTTAGLYETSGDWLYDVGLPGKSGIGGGIVTVAPGKGGLGTFAPLLDAAGNSVKGQLAAPSCRAGWASTSSPRSTNGESRASRRSPGARAAGDRARRPGAGRAGAGQALRAGRPARRAAHGAAGPASRTSRSTSTCSSTSRRWRCAGRGQSADLVKIAPTAERLSTRALRVPPRLPGQRARPGLRLRALAAALTEGQTPTVYAHVATDPGAPGQARAPVLAVLRLQRLEQPARGRLGDDPARLRRLERGRRR